MGGWTEPGLARLPLYGLCVSASDARLSKLPYFVDFPLAFMTLSIRMRAPVHPLSFTGMMSRLTTVLAEIHTDLILDYSITDGASKVLGHWSNVPVAKVRTFWEGPSVCIAIATPSSDTGLRASHWAYSFTIIAANLRIRDDVIWSVASICTFPWPVLLSR